MGIMRVLKKHQFQKQLLEMLRKRKWPSESVVNIIYKSVWKCSYSDPLPKILQNAQTSDVFGRSFLMQLRIFQHLLIHLHGNYLHCLSPPFSFFSHTSFIISILTLILNFECLSSLLLGKFSIKENYSSADDSSERNFMSTDRLWAKLCI